MNSKWIVLFFSLNLVAISAFSKVQVEGKILIGSEIQSVTLNLPTILGTKNLDFGRIQLRVKYFDEQGIKQTIRPKDSVEVQFSYKGESIRMVSRPNVMNIRGFMPADEFAFFRLEIDGPLQLLTCFVTRSTVGHHDPNSGLITPGSQYHAKLSLIQRADLSSPHRIGWLDFRKDLADYLSDCPELVEKIKAREYKQKAKHIRDIVEFYNSNCG